MTAAAWSLTAASGLNLPSSVFFLYSGHVVITAPLYEHVCVKDERQSHLWLYKEKKKRQVLKKEFDQNY